MPPPDRRSLTRAIEGNLAADNGTETGALGSVMKAWGTVESVAIAKRDDRIVEGRGSIDQIFRQRSAS